MGKGEIARYEQFLLFPQCFQKACFLEASKGVIVWEWVKKGWSLKAGGLLIQVVSNTGLTLFVQIDNINRWQIKNDLNDRICL